MVRRLLPAVGHRMVGPFIFFDHFGPITLPPGQGMDVRPHPHIHLATVTYLFEGEFVHRDSLGSLQVIRPGDLNWMTAGRGIVHSERSDPAHKAAGGRMHGIQIWVALPRAEEERAPSFEHHPVATLPLVEWPGMRGRVIAGEGWGARSPAKTLSPLFYGDAILDEGAVVEAPQEHERRAVFVVEGGVEVGGTRVGLTEMAVLAPGRPAAVRAVDGPARVVIVAGAPLDGERHIWWNFVSSSKERIDQAARDWKEGRFPKIPGDDVEFIPLPER